MPTSQISLHSCRYLIATLLAVGLPAPGKASAQEPPGLQAVAAIESALVDAIAEAEKSVVAIARVRPEELSTLEPITDPFGRQLLGPPPARPGDPDWIPNDYGTGVVVDRAGLIVTHYHVLGGDTDQYYVTTSSRKVLVARLKAADPRSDLAVLQVEANDLVPIKFGDAATLRKGQIVLALGNPYAIARDGQVCASWGIVSNLARKALATIGEDGRSTKTLHQSGTLIQTDAKLNLGTSGGALVNLKGEMVGLITAAAALPGAEQAAGYAVPVDETFRRVVETLKQGREVEYGFLGVHYSKLDRQEAESGKHGIKVGDIVPGSPADRFGLQREDIISHVNGQPIYDADGLQLQIGKLPVEAMAHLTVERPVLSINGTRSWKTVPVNVELTKYPVEGKKVVTAPSPSWRGIRVDYATAKRQFVEAGGAMMRRGQFPIGELHGSESYVLVTEVDRQSGAWKEGLRPDMFVTHVENDRVRNPKEFRAAVAGKTGPLKLRVISPVESKATIKIIPADEP